MRSDGEKDGSDPILTRRHFAERLDGTVKGRKIDVATGFFTGVLPRIRGKTSEPQAETRPAADALSKKMNRRREVPDWHVSQRRLGRDRPWS